MIPLSIFASITRLDIVLVIASVSPAAEGFNIIILGLIYWRPGKMYDLYLDTLTEIIEDLSGEHGEYPVILGGDFNSRIGHSNQLSSE
uniref:Endonuclease/exonuclease/phosphatase domain-containing protein n=1 Tax=Rhodnius prolixus TaxID=13249 RepID=T1HDY5_RHOPR